MRRLPRGRSFWPFLALTALLSGCGGELQTPGEALRIFDQSLPEAFLDEQYDAPVRAVGGLRPYEFSLQDGQLPSGLQLSGGMIRGVPGETGTFEFTIAVSDANLSQTFNDYRLSVVERPPPSLSLSLPQTEIRQATTLRLRVEDASELRAVSARLEWDPELLSLEEGSVAAERRDSALLVQSGEGFLQLDLAALGGAWNGELTLARLRLVPAQALVPDVELSAQMLDDRGGRHQQGIAPALEEESVDVQDAIPNTDEEEEPAEDLGTGDADPGDAGTEDTGDTGTAEGADAEDEGDTPPDDDPEDAPPDVDSDESPQDEGAGVAPDDRTGDDTGDGTGDGTDDGSVDTETDGQENR